MTLFKISLSGVASAGAVAVPAVPADGSSYKSLCVYSGKSSPIDKNSNKYCKLSSDGFCKYRFYSC